MNISFLRNSNPSSKLFILLFLCLTFTLVTMMIGGALVNVLYGMDIFSDPEILQDINVPYVRAANLLLMVFNALGFFILPSFVFRKIFYLDIPQNLFFKKKNILKHVGIGVAVFALFIPFTDTIIHLNKMIIEYFIPVSEAINNLDKGINSAEDILLRMSTPFDLVITIIVAALIPAIGEELLFRGVVQKIIAQRTGNIHTAIWISALAFSLLHFHIMGFAPRIILGALLGYIFISTNNIWASIAAHFMNNAIVISLAYAIQNSSSKETIAAFENTGFHWSIIVISCVIGIILLGFVFNKSMQSNQAKIYCKTFKYHDVSSDS